MELLSPAGNFESAIAAFHGGADAIYLGGKNFSARMGADNFSEEELTKIADFAHQIGKKVYVTLNTLLFEDEFEPAVEFAAFLCSVGIDAIIVQDLGLAYYLHQALPELPLHASTQLNCHNIEQAKALKQIGFTRVVLAREANKDFISEVKAIGLEVEVFIHGALCVSYSGNCLLSSFNGGRSGNRGRCAQPCRMKYDIFEDGVKINEDVYAISTKDLQTIDEVKELQNAGADSLKIEGRLKSKEYVYQTAKAYFDALHSEVNPQEKAKLQALYSRGFTKGYLFDESPFRLLSQGTSSHQGEEIGVVTQVRKERVTIHLSKTVHRLDGIRFLSGDPFGVTLERIFVKGNPVEEAFPGDFIDIPKIENAQGLEDVKVIRTTNYALEESIDEEIRKPFRVPIKGTLTIKIGQPLRLEVEYLGVKVETEGGIAETAKTSGTPVSRIQEQLAKSGNYPYFIDAVTVNGDDAFIPISLLNNLRNQAYEALSLKLIVHRNPIRKEYVAPTPKEVREPSKIYVSWKADPNDSPVNWNRVITGKPTHAPFEIVPFACLIPESSNAIASPYCNITNSFAIDAFVSLGFSGIVFSLELDQRSISATIDAYRSRHDELPALGMFVYGRPEVMIMKSCPIGTLTHSKTLHCQKCHQHSYCLEDAFGARYPVLGDSSCTTRIYGSKKINLFEYTIPLRQMGITFFLAHFTDENEEEIENVKNENVPFSPKIHTSGHFRKRSL